MFFIFLLHFIHCFTVSEFYFVRHGQTDFNSGKQKKYKDTLMNEYGEQQIEKLKFVVQKLPIEVMYFSPLKRTAQTKDILNEVLQVPEICMSEIKEIRTKFLFSKKKLDKISQGINKILADWRIALVVGHGNIYKAICDILDIKTDILKINNGMLVHFYQNENGYWLLDVIADSSNSINK